MNLTVFDEIEQGDQEALSVDAASLYRAFEHVKDGRKAKGKRYPLALLFTLILLGPRIAQRVAQPFMALFECENLPSRSALSRFLASLSLLGDRSLAHALSRRSARASSGHRGRTPLSGGGT